MIKKLPLWIFLVMNAALVYGQGKESPDNTSIKLEEAYVLINNNNSSIGISRDQLTNLKVTHTYQDAISKATMVYAQQTYEEIPIYNAILVMAFKNGKLFSLTGKRKFNYPAAGNNFKTSQISAEDAVLTAAGHLGLKVKEKPSARKIATTEESALHFGGLGIGKEDILVTKVWMPQERGDLRLTWQVEIQPVNTQDHWLIRIDVKENKVLDKNNYTTYCKWDGLMHEESGHNATHTEVLLVQSHAKNAKTASGYQYRVVPFPYESILHAGNTSLVNNPWTLAGGSNNATTWGWHNDGTTEHEGTTRGNNVYAMEDWNANNGIGHSPGPTASGEFDYIYNEANTTFEINSANQNASIVNLFYWNNLMHDLTFQYGFDEVAGNFQATNGDRGGQGNDFVYADANDGGGWNNANFSTPPDGSNPRMQMYSFLNESKLIRINNHATLPANIFAVNASNAIVPVRNIANGATAEVRYLGDLLCVPVPDNTFANKIALIDRGTCDFTTKIINAQKAGALGVIVVNNVPGAASIMGGVTGNIIPTIPAVMVSMENGQLIKSALEVGEVNVTVGPPDAFRDGSLDNGIIVHEYTHGISNRLTGGPGNSSCLTNAEQPGEGWSDYFALMVNTNWTSAQLSDGPNARSMAAYALTGDISGGGFRTFPYSTDQSVNPWNYGYMATHTSGAVHTIGEIWAATLWDMTWEIIKKDGVINTDLFNATASGGNSVALKLVIQGMKLQTCSPGFLDARDAILKADTLLYDGRYSCAIWTAFAGRGMGFKAVQGSSNSYLDQVADFSMPHALISRLTTQTVSAGSTLEYAVDVTNYSCTPFTGDIRESLPEGLEYVSGASYNPATRTVSFDQISLEVGESKTFTYLVRATAKNFKKPAIQLLETVSEPSITNFVATTNAALEWVVTETRSHSSGRSYFAANAETSEDKRLTSMVAYPIEEGTFLSFWHYYDTEATWDGGVIELSNDNGNNWFDAGPYFFENGYNSYINENPDSPISTRNAFTGNSGTFIKSILNLSPLAGQNIQFRFRFGSDVYVGSDGWYIDDIQVYNSTYHISTADLYLGDISLSSAPNLLMLTCPEFGSLYVDGNNVNEGNGNSWNSVMVSMADAVEIANNCTDINSIRVAKGIYYPEFIAGNGTSARDQAFTFTRGNLSVLGGYPFGGADDLQRDIKVNETVLHGDIDRNSLLDGGNVYHVVVVAGEGVDQSMILDGFTISGGNADSFESKTVAGKHFAGNNGGGLANVGGKPHLQNLLFSNNKATNGGGLYIQEESPQIHQVQFRSNEAESKGGAVYSSVPDKEVMVVNGLFANNSASHSGGAIYNELSVLKLVNNTIFGNSTPAGTGGAVHNISPHLNIYNCIVWGNTSATELSIVGAPATVENSIVERGFTGNGNSNEEPKFTNAEIFDFTLQKCSPAIDKGKFEHFPASITVDVANNNRKVGSQVDMGAYEFTGMTAPAELLGEHQDLSLVSITGAGRFPIWSNSDNCRIIANIQTDGTDGSVDGLVTAKVWVETTQPLNYLKRHYEITPQQNASTAKGNVTLYFLQQEFTDFNEQIPAPAKLLPMNAEDLEGYRSNIRIEKLSGTGNENGVPDSYTAGFGENIVPSEITWNNQYSRWEVSCDVSGFSGFFLKTQDLPLPLQLTSFWVVKEKGLNIVLWTTIDEVHTQEFEIQASSNARDFVTIGKVESENNQENAYEYQDDTQNGKAVYYRLRMVDQDGTYSYSPIYSVSEDRNPSVVIFPNPVRQTLNLQFDKKLLTTGFQIMDVTGKIVLTGQLNTMDYAFDMKSLTTGVYIIRFEDGNTLRFMKY